MQHQHRKRMIRLSGGGTARDNEAGHNEGGLSGAHGEMGSGPGGAHGGSSSGNHGSAGGTKGSYDKGNPFGKGQGNSVLADKGVMDKYLGDPEQHIKNEREYWDAVGNLGHRYNDYKNKGNTSLENFGNTLAGLASIGELDPTQQALGASVNNPNASWGVDPLGVAATIAGTILGGPIGSLYSLGKKVTGYDGPMIGFDGYNDQSPFSNNVNSPVVTNGTVLGGLGHSLFGGGSGTPQHTGGGLSGDHTAHGTTDLMNDPVMQQIMASSSTGGQTPPLPGAPSMPAQEPFDPYTYGLWNGEYIFDPGYYANHRTAQGMKDGGKPKPQAQGKAQYQASDTRTPSYLYLNPQLTPDEQALLDWNSYVRMIHHEGMMNDLRDGLLDQNQTGHGSSPRALSYAREQFPPMLNGMAQGGYPRQGQGIVQGPGGPKDDMVGPIMLSNKEYVLPVEMVKHFGGGNYNKGLGALESVRNQVTR